MGLTIESPHISIDMGSGGFLRLRRTIASLCPKEINKHYQYLLDNIIHLSHCKEDADAYDAQTEIIYQKYKKQYGKVIDFLYAPDTGAKLTYGAAKQLLKVIGDYDDDAIYGYAGWGPNAAKFSDFKALLQDCADCKKPLKWW